MVTRTLRFSGVLFYGHSANKKFIQIELTLPHISLTVPDVSVIHWFDSNLRWAAETIPYQIEGNLSTSSGRWLETLVVESPDFYENCKQIEPKNFPALKTGTNFTEKNKTKRLRGNKNYIICRNNIPKSKGSAKPNLGKFIH